jgi:hypothetical protein
MDSIDYGACFTIAIHMSPKDIVNLSLVSRSFEWLMNEEYLFRALYLRDFQPFVQGAPLVLQGDQTWKNVYRTLFQTHQQMRTTMQIAAGLQIRRVNFPHAAYYFHHDLPDNNDAPFPFDGMQCGSMELSGRYRIGLKQCEIRSRHGWCGLYPSSP